VDEEWRVSVTGGVRLADGKRVSVGAVRDLLASHAGGEVSVTAGKPGVFLYAASADAAAALEGSAREALFQQGLTADIRSERWDPSRRAWLPGGDATAAELPAPPERGPGRKRLRAAGTVIGAIIDGISNAGSLALAGSGRTA
jgi:hypothetical protein